jgi:YbbR domain-containing protein
MPVQIEYNKNAVANGYNVGTATVDPQKVEVTGAKGEVNQIDQIVAKLPLPNGINHTYQRQVILVAEDSKGRQLNAVITPSTANVKLPVSLSKKTVKLNLRPKNEKNNKVYSVTAKNDQVTLYGKKSVLAKINQLNVDVDLKGIDSSTVRNYPLVSPKGVARADPAEVQISIKVKDSSN